MTLDQPIALATELRSRIGGDAVVVLEDETGPARLRALEAGQVHALDVGNGVAVFDWEPQRGSWRRDAVILR